MTDFCVNPGRGHADDPSSLSSSLLERLKADHPEAWQRLVHLFGPVVYEWCRKKGLQPADAADISQEVFRTVASGIINFRRDRPGDTFRGWLWTIAHSKLVDHWRRQYEHPQAPGGSDFQIPLAEAVAPSFSITDEDSDARVPSSLYRRALEILQGEFEETTWRAFWRVVVDSATPKDTAAEMRISVNSVYLAKSRVLRRLREELGDLFD